jgi:polyisoprenoid-binding protein YceI
MSTRYTLDASHSRVGFSVRHMMITNVRGEFQKAAGEVTFDAAAPVDTRITGTIEVASINTREEKRDAHLRSADFFDAEQFPQLTFASTGVKPTADGLDVTGDLTIHGVTRSVVLHVTEITPEHTDPWGNRRIGALARTQIKRSEYGMTWNAALEAGGILVADDVKIEIEAQLIRQA